jgi:hypothetical protein
MGKYGLKSGYIKSQNMQAGNGVVTLDGSGNGTLAVTFKRKFKNAPKVLLQEQVAAGANVQIYPASKTVSGFTITVAGAGVTGAFSVDYYAMDDPASL